MLCSFLFTINFDSGISFISQHSPGYSAKYTTYSLMDDITDKVVQFELVQVCVHDNSEIWFGYFIITLSSINHGFYFYYRLQNHQAL